MNRTLRMWMIWVMAAAAPFFIFPSEAAVWDGPRSHPAAQKVEDAYVYVKYVDIHGRDIYATQTIKGVSGDYINGNDYIRNITTYRFVPGRNLQGRRYRTYHGDPPVEQDEALEISTNH